MLRLHSQDRSGDFFFPRQSKLGHTEQALVMLLVNTPSDRLLSGSGASISRPARLGEPEQVQTGSFSLLHVLDSSKKKRKLAATWRETSHKQPSDPSEA